ncbi:methyl-accepting chemotaxis protein [Duganella sp. FT27W]|uniref:methyl-accepting chemotaxis protein n=1 Tax=Duganella sp. FT27W TaxID=2654636 RepID=UPI00128E6D83|nr:methyl-accepting chemotaxis protein [Duganella sp. FT27W]MPQ59738.1 HAMP domain-containing protein [Duganella sp. FT27W]
MNISNFKIGTRLAAGFGIVLLLLVMVAAMAISRIQSINAATDTMLEDRYVKVMLTKSIQDEVNAQARFIRNATIGANDTAEVTSSLAKLEDSVQKNTKALEQFKGMINSDEGRRLFDVLTETRGGYAQAREAAVKLLRDGQAEAAGQYVLKNLRPPQNKFFDALKTMVEFQEKLMQESADEARNHGSVAIKSTLILSAIAALAAIVIGVIITRSITIPVNRAVDVARTVAAGDLTSRITVTSKDEIGMLLASLAEMNDNLKKIVGEVRNGTEEIATATTEVATGNMDLSSRTEEQASALEETASSMEELTSTVKQNSENARQANQLAQSAAAVAVRGGDVVSQVVATMESINTSASKIVDIISVIDGIAFQTNILALNAAVEAARAGEQGRGFAVVASEVRNLAQRSASAAKEIKVLIGDSVEKVEAGNKLVSTAGTTMDEVVASVHKLTSIVGEITTASREQEMGIEQINEAITSMDTVTQQNAALVEEAAAATSALQEQAGKLAQAVSVFKLDEMASAATAAPVRKMTRPVAALKPAVKAPVRQLASAPKPAPATKFSSQVKEAEWEEF